MPRKPAGLTDDQNAPSGSVLLSEVAYGKDDDAPETAAQRQRRLEAERRERADELAELDGLSDGDFFKAVQELEYGEDVKFIVVRVKPAHKQGYVGEIPAADMSLETLKQKFGPGKYRCRAQGPRGFVAGGGSATVADFVPEEHHKAAERDGGSRAIISEFLALQEMQEEKRRQDRKDMMTILAPVLTAAIPAILGNRGPDLAGLLAAMKPPSMAEMVTVMTGLKQLQGKETSEMDTFMRAMEFAKEMHPSERETGWLDVVKEVAGPLLGRIGPAVMSRPFVMPKRNLPTPTAPAQLTQENAPSPTQPQVAQNSPQQQPHSEEEMNILQWLAWMREQLVMLVSQASRDRDPVLYASVMADNIPEDENGVKLIPLDKLLEFIEGADWWEKLCKFESGVTPYKKWFEEFRKEFIDILKEAKGEGENVTKE